MTEILELGECSVSAARYGSEEVPFKRIKHSKEIQEDKSRVCLLHLQLGGYWRLWVRGVLEFW